MHDSNGLSRVEVILLLGIGAIVVALVLPAVEQARQAARQSSCKNNLKQVGLALDNYHETFNSYPYGCIGNPKLTPSQRWSWYPRITSQLAQEPNPPINYAKRSDIDANVPLSFRVAWKEGETRTFSLRHPYATICPNGVEETDTLGQALATYVGMAGAGKDAPTLPVTHERAGMWAYDRLTTRIDVQKTAASTIHVIETAADRGSWYRGGPATVRPFLRKGESPIGKNGQFGGFHPGVAMTLFADGSVKPLPESIDADVFRNMATIAADE